MIVIMPLIIGQHPTQMPRTVDQQMVWVPNIVSQRLIWAFAVVSGSALTGSRDGSAAAVLDRLAYVRLDRAARPITGVEGRRDLGVTASARGASPPGRHSAAIVGGPGDPFRARAATPPAPSTPPFRHTTDTPALARRPGEATLDLPQARAGTTTDPAHAPGPGTAVGDRESDLGISPYRRRDRRAGPQGLPSDRLGDLEKGRVRSGTSTR